MWRAASERRSSDTAPSHRVPSYRDTSPLENLSPYDRSTVNLWSRSYRELINQPGFGHFIEAAVHAVLTGLRQHRDPASLFSSYDAGAAADFALIRSLLPDESSEELCWKVRDAAFYLRWVELTGSG